MSVLTAVIATLASAILYSRCFPPANQAWLAWLALVPLLVVIRRRSLITALVVTWAFTVATAYATGDWFPRAVSQYYNQPPLVGIGFFFAVSTLMAGPGTLVFALCYRRLASRPRLALPLLTGAAWVTGELLRARLIGNPWVLFGYSQADVTVLVQVADLTGPYGVAFVLVAVNAALAELWLAWRAGGAIRPALRGLALSGVVALLALVYGVARLGAGWPTPSGGPVGVAIVQGNLDLGSQWRPEFYGENLRTYLQLTTDTLRRERDGTSLVIWPENAMSFFLDEEPLYRAAIAEVLSFSRVELIAGGPRADDAGERRYFNSAYLLAPDGSTRARYDKERLLPFAEYFPFPSLDYLRRNFGRAREFTAGTSVQPLPTVAGAAAVAICNESMFPEIVAERTRAGADYLINLSNDSWIPDAKFSEITFNKVRFRAIEQRRFLVRASTSGPSAIVDPFGRVQARGGVLSRTVVIGSISPLKTTTAYLVWGDAFAVLCVLAVLAVLTWDWRAGARADRGAEDDAVSWRRAVAAR